MSIAVRCLLIGLAAVAATASTWTNAETGSDTAQADISITKLPSLNVSRVRNGELLFSVDRRSNQSFLQLDSGGQTMPYRLAASYREISAGTEVPISADQASPYSVYWSDQRQAAVALQDLVSSEVVMQSQTQADPGESVLHVERTIAPAVDAKAVNMAHTLILTFVIE